MRMHTVHARAVLVKETAGFPEFLDCESEFTFEYDDVRDIIKVLDVYFPKVSKYPSPGEDFWTGDFTFFFHYPEGCRESEEDFLDKSVAYMEKVLDYEYYQWVLVRMAE
jgi:hypothetical protein